MTVHVETYAQSQAVGEGDRDQRVDQREVQRTAMTR